MSYLNATGAKAGFEQSGGGYFYIVDTNLPSKLLIAGGTTVASGSGGSWNVGSFIAAGPLALPGGVSTLFGSGRIVRDMGKTLVSAGRTFRKIKGMNPTNLASSALGVLNSDAGSVASGSNPGDQGYLTFYVETTREGDGVVAPAGLVRYM